MALMEAVWTPAVARVREEVADMQAIADKEGAGLRIAPWDYRYYAEKVRKAKYDLDENEVEALPPAREAARGDVLGRGRALRPPLHARPGASPSTTPTCASTRSRTPPASTSASGTSTPTPAPASSPGAWMNEYRDPGALRDATIPTIVSNNSNFVKGQAGRAGADLLGRREDAVPRVRPRPARPLLERHLPLALRHRRSPATTSSSRPRSSSTGSRRRRCSTASRSTTRPGSRSRRSSSPRSRRPRRSTRASTRSSTWRARSST